MLHETLTTRLKKTITDQITGLKTKTHRQTNFFIASHPQEQNEERT